MRGASVIVIVVLTAAAACSSPPPAPPPPPPAPTSKTPDPRAALSSWAAGFCYLDSALSSELFQERPAPLSLAPTEADRRQLLDNLNKTSALFARARELSVKLDPAPSKAANDLLIRYRQLLDKSATDTADSAKSISRLPLDDLNTMSTIFGLSAMAYQGDVSSAVTDAKKADPALKDAFATARGCFLYAN